MEILPIITNALIAFSVLLFLALVVSYTVAKIKKKNQPAPVTFKPERIDVRRPVKPRKTAAESLKVTSMLDHQRQSEQIEGSRAKKHSADEPKKRISTAERFTKVETKSNPNIYDLAQYQTRSTSSHKTILVKKRVSSSTGENRFIRFDKKSTVGKARMTIVNSEAIENENSFDYYNSKEFDPAPAQRYYNY